MANQNQPQPTILRLEFPTDAELIGTSYKQRVIAVVTRGQNAVQIGMIQFELDGIPSGSPAPLNATGRVVKDIFGLQAGKVHTISAVLIGTGFSVSEQRAVAKVADSTEEAECKIIPLVLDDKVEIIISASTKSGKDLADVPIDIYVYSNKSASEHISTKTDAHGDCRREFALDKKERKEITILVTGFPEGEFRRTFKGY